MAEQSLKDKTVKGTIWSGIDNIVQFGVTFVVSIILARLLSPDDYGLIGIIAIFTAVCTALINGGFTTALIRKKDATDDDYNTAFIVNLGVSVLLYVVIFLCSPFIADFFHREELVALTQVSSLGMIIGALGLVQQTRLTKRIDFKTQTKITIVASVASGIVGIFMALIGFGVWSLVAQSLTSQGLRTLLMSVVNKWVPQFRFSSESFHELFGFGWKMMVSGVLDTVWKELYQVVVGKFYSPATLGQYTRAKQFSTLFSSNLTTVIQRVTYPVLSNIQDDKERMILAYRKIIKLTIFITAICMFFLGAISEPLLYCLIGPKWHEAATYLPLICIIGSFYPLHAINLNMLQVQGRSDLFLGLEIVKKMIGILPLSVCFMYGIMPMLYVSVLTSIICYFLNSYFPGKLLGYSSWMQIKDIAPSYILAILVALSVFFLKFIPISYWIILPGQIILGSTVLLYVCHKTKMEEYMELKRMIEPYYKKMNEQKKYNWMVFVRCTTFNQAPFIIDAMNGFTMQKTNFPFICAIIDDASTDGEQEVIKKYLNEHFDLEDNKVVRHEETDDYVLTFVRHKENLNCFFAVVYLKYNHYSIKKSKDQYLSEWRDNAKYIAVCEGDDRWIDPNKLKKQFVLLESNPNCNICTHNALIAMPAGKERQFTNISEDKIFSITRVMLMRWFTPTASFFYRNNVEVPSTYAEMGANGDMGLLYSNLLKGKLYYSSDVMSVYNYATPGSLSSKTPRKVLYQKKINLFRAINKVTKYRYSYLTLPLIWYLNLKRIASKNEKAIHSL